MKTKSSRNNKLAKPQPARVTAVTENRLPNAEELKRQAGEETKRHPEWAYWETIKILREEKAMSFREVAEWLSARGVETDRWAVYRVYQSTLFNDPSAQSIESIEFAQEREGDNERGVMPSDE